MISSNNTALRRQRLVVQIHSGAPLFSIKYGVYRIVPESVCSLFSPFESHLISIGGGKNVGKVHEVFP